MPLPLLVPPFAAGAKVEKDALAGGKADKETDNNSTSDEEPKVGIFERAQKENKNWINRIFSR